MASSDQEQTDKALRTTLHYSIYAPKQRFQVRSAYFSEYLHFTSPDAHIDAEYRLNTFAMESDYQRQAGSLNFILGFHSRVNMADVPFYKRKEKQADAGLYLSVLNYWKKPGWKTALNLRQDLAEGYLVPFCPSLGAEGRITKTLSARLTLSRNFRIPTMNDRFWQPGGNPVLEPESSWNQEAGVTWTPFLKNKPFLLEHSLTVYNIMIDNLIQWVSKGSYWSPENVDKVWSRGVEAESRIHLSTSIGRATMKVRYAFAPSGKMDEKGKATKQLIYIPKHRATFSGTWQLKTYYGSVTCTYNGERFVNPENTLSMPRYVLVNLTLGREFRLRQSLLRLQLDARNVLDTEYQVVKYFPEPGFTVLMNLVISI
jgi:iron complex outermembrane receptor protein